MPLWGASQEGWLDTIEVLLNRGAKVNQRNDVRILYYVAAM